MDTHAIILFTVAFFEFVLCIYLFTTRTKGHVVYSYCLFIFAVALWAFGNAMYRLPITTSAAIFWDNVMFFAAVLIGVSFVYFAIVFPYLLRAITRWDWIAIITPVVFFSIIIFWAGAIVHDVIGSGVHKTIVYGKGMNIFSLWFVLYFGVGCKILLDKMKRIEGIHRWQLRTLLYGVFISGILGITFDLFFPWLGGPQLFYIGPESSVVWLGFTTYIIFKK